jgi:hypothetical protein
MQTGRHIERQAGWQTFRQAAIFSWHPVAAGWIKTLDLMIII